VLANCVEGPGRLDTVRKQGQREKEPEKKRGKNTCARGKVRTLQAEEMIHRTGKPEEDSSRGGNRQ